MVQCMLAQIACNTRILRTKIIIVLRIYMIERRLARFRSNYAPVLKMKVPE